MPNAILRIGPFIGLLTTLPDYLNQPSSASVNVIPVNCNIRSWSKDDWKYYVGGATSGEYKNVSSDDATVSETIAEGFLEGDGIFFAYQAAEDFTLAGTYSATAESGQQDIVSFKVGYNGDTFLYEDQDSENISGSYSVTFPAAVKPKVAFLHFTSETDATGTVTINGINPT